MKTDNRKSKFGKMGNWAAFILAAICWLLAPGALRAQHISGALDVQNNWSARQNFSNLENRIYADQMTGADAGAKINAAIAIAGNYGVVDARGFGSATSAASDVVINARVTLYLPCGAFTFAAGARLRVEFTGAAIIGCGPTATFLISSGTSGDFIVNTTGTQISLTRIENLTIQTTSTRTANALLNATNLDQGVMHNVVLLGNWWDVFDHLGSGSGSWTYDHIKFPGGQTVNRIWFVQASSGTSSGLNINQSTIYDQTTYQSGGAAVDLDTGTDGVKITDSSTGIIHLHNSLAGSPPQYTRIIGVGEEGNAQTYNNVVVDDCKDVSIIGSYFGSGQTALTVNAGSDIKFIGNHIVSMALNGIHLAGGTRILVEGNTITDVSQSSNKASAAIQVDAGVSQWYVRDNTYRHTAGYTNIAKNGVTVSSGASDYYDISGNDFGVAGTDYGTGGDPAVSDAGTGTNKLASRRDLAGRGPNGSITIAPSGSGSVLMPASAPAQQSILNLTTLGAVGGAGAAANVILSDGVNNVAAGKLVGAFGNGAGTRYIGVLVGADRDANKLPFDIFTTDSGGSLQQGFQVAGGQSPGTAGAVTIGGQLVSTLSTGTAPFSVASTTNVANLNASSLSGATFAAPGAIGGTTPGTGAFTSLAAGSAKWNVNTSGLPTQSNNLTLAGQGFPAILGITSQKSETTTADANVLTVTPASAAGTYRACVVVSVSAATSGVISWTLSWTDSNGAAQSNIAQDLFQQGTAAPNTTFTTSAAGNYNGCTTFDVNNGGANIVVKWVGGGTTTAKMSATIERII
jgi:hypothetical protein